MRVLGNLSIVKELAAKFPFGATIQNETDVQDGTPVVREIYGDILMNLYRILGLTNTNPNGTEDSTDTQFQLVEALKKLPNDINDYERVLELSGLIWNVDLDLSILPDKFVFFAKATDDYNGALTYEFKGTGVLTLPFYSSGYASGDLLIIVVDTSGVVAYSMNVASGTPQTLVTPFGNPVSYNYGTQMMYQEGGNLLTDAPSVNDLENTIRVDQSDGTLIVENILIASGYAVCVTKKPSDATYYKLFLFQLPDLNTVYEMTVIGGTLLGTENPHLIIDGEEFFFTNDGGADANDYVIAQYGFSPSIKQLNKTATYSLESTFPKTSNSVVIYPNIYTFVSGELSQYGIVTGLKTVLGNYGGVSGQIFKFGGSVYFGSGEVATKWSL